MKTLKYSALLITLLLQQVCFADQANQTTDRVLSTTDKLVGYGKHIKVNNIIKVNYMFEVFNNSPNFIYGITVGQESLLNNDPFIYIDNYSPDSLVFSQPVLSWRTGTENLPESLMFSLIWRSPNIRNKAFSLLPNTKYTGFGVDFPNRYPPLWNTVALFETDQLWTDTVVKLTKGDTIAPTATITPTVTANTIKKGFYNINFKVQAKDNYDPLPEIIFDSIQDITTSATNPSPFGAGYTLNIANNIIRGIYPTVITIAADAKIAKKYKINYKITDASDNQRIVSAVVTIPKQ
jgi:hypothetical protein